MAASRVARARESEKWLVEWYRQRGWPGADHPAASLRGRDITGLPGLAPEVKARYRFEPRDWLKQAARNAGRDVPYAILRCNGQGYESINQWLVVMTLEEHTKLLREAGYGSEDG